MTDAPVLVDNGEPTIDELKALLETAHLISGAGTTLDLPAQVRTQLALFDNGVLFVQREYIHSPYILSVEHDIRQRKLKYTTKRVVELPTLQTIFRMTQDQRSPVKMRGAQVMATPMQRAFRALLEKACERRASDLHITVDNGITTLRLRIDGLLTDFGHYGSEYGSELCAAAFNSADVSDASFSPLQVLSAQITNKEDKLPETLEAVRMQFVPLARLGLKLVVRLQYRAKTMGSSEISKLGYTEGQQKLLRRMRGRTNGINFVTGPTGSGKTTTLTRVLTAHNTETGRRLHFLTVEDPPEQEIGGGVSQIPITNAKTPEERKLRFGQALHATLRLDPDVIMIGEIRDYESARIAFQASMTGHVVYSTLHTNTALGALPRLRDLGVEDWKIFDPEFITGLVAQRLIAVTCPHCRVPLAHAEFNPRCDADRYERLVRRYGAVIDQVFVSGPGCDHCNGTGQLGRTVAAEVILPDERLMQLVKEGNTPVARAYWLAPSSKGGLGGFSMLDHAEMKVLEGTMCPIEVEMVLGLLPETPYQTRSAS
jgi:general secretion pathway protein E